MTEIPLASSCRDSAQHGVIAEFAHPREHLERPLVGRERGLQTGARMSPAIAATFMPAPLKVSIIVASWANLDQAIWAAMFSVPGWVSGGPRLSPRFPAVAPPWQPQWEKNRCRRKAELRVMATYRMMPRLEETTKPTRVNLGAVAVLLEDLG